MRTEKALIGLLRGLVALLTDEAARNPAFSSKLDALLSCLPKRTAATAGGTRRKPADQDLPDIHAEWNTREEPDFRLWLRDLPIPLLRQIIRKEDLDATGRAVKWKDAEKLAAFIADSLRARQARGSAFIGRDVTG